MNSCVRAFWISGCDWYVTIIHQVSELVPTVLERTGIRRVLVFLSGSVGRLVFSSFKCEKEETLVAGSFSWGERETVGTPTVTSWGRGPWEVRREFNGDAIFLSDHESFSHKITLQFVFTWSSCWCLLWTNRILFCVLSFVRKGFFIFRIRRKFCRSDNCPSSWK